MTFGSGLGDNSNTLIRASLIVNYYFLADIPLLYMLNHEIAFQKENSMNEIQVNSLVELTPSQSTYSKRTLKPHEGSLLAELLTDTKYFYLGAVPNLEGISLLASADTGKIISVNDGIFQEVTYGNPKKPL